MKSLRTSITGAAIGRLSESSLLSTGLFVLLLMSAASTALAQVPLPPEQDAGEISFREGGIGAREASAMRAAASDYPLMLSFAEYLGGQHAYTSNVDVRIAPADGRGPRLATNSGGPLMLIDLPAGTYNVVATQGGESLRRTVNVDRQQTERVFFEWGRPEQG